MVGSHWLAVEIDLAGEAMTLVEIARGQYVAGCQLWSSDREAVEGEANHGLHAGVFDAAAEGMVVILAGFFGMSTTAVLNFPGTSIAATGIEGIEQGNAG